MRLVRFGADGKERPGLLDPRGVLRDLSAHLDDWTGAHLAPEELERVRRLDHGRLPAIPAGGRLGVPVGRIAKCIAIGLNYSDHAREARLAVPKEPVVFSKAVSSLCGPNDPVILPRGSKKTDWEVELGVVIGARARYVEEEHALACVAGYCLANDISEREFQLERGGTWDKGKGCDTFGPIGPWLATADEIPDPQGIGLWLEVNGVRRQAGNTGNMIFGVASLVAYVSRFITLEPGDIVLTGTPAGVGMGILPRPVFLAEGDQMRLGGDALGVQDHRVVSCGDDAR